MTIGAQTHWKKLHNPDYLGAYALDPGKDLIVTIKTVAVEKVVGPDGKKEECMVMRFQEQNAKPMIVNSTNAKTIEKLYKTPYIEEWKGRKIQLFVDKVKAFGEIVDALRVRPYLPKSEKIQSDCADCCCIIEGFGSMNAEQMGQYTYQKYGKPLCSECAKKLNNVGKVADVLDN
jgi:hypothetical protein